MDFTKLELIRFELEHILIPQYYYSEPDKTSEQMIEYLFTGKFMAAAFEEICEEDGVECPYDESDFPTRFFEYKNMKVVQINMPEADDTRIRHALRLYFVYEPLKLGGKVGLRKYFLTEVSNGKLVMLHINEKGEQWLAEELKEDDNEEEILFECYFSILDRAMRGLPEGKKDEDKEEE